MSERRESKRFAVHLNKITTAEVTLDANPPTPCYVYVADISEGGLRITTDAWYDRAQRFGLRLQLDHPLQVTVEVIWSKQLAGGTNVYGLQFVDVTDEQSAQVLTFIDSYSQEARRRRLGFNLNRVMGIQFPGVTESQIYVLTNVLSADSLEITAEIYLEQGQGYDCHLFLETDQAPVATRAIVREIKPAVFDRFRIHCDLEHPSTDGVERINAFLDKVLRHEIEGQPVLHEFHVDPGETT